LAPPNPRRVKNLTSEDPCGSPRARIRREGADQAARRKRSPPASVGARESLYPTLTKKTRKMPLSSPFFADVHGKLIARHAAR
jgi:hypothetical protein